MQKAKRKNSINGLMITGVIINSIMVLLLKCDNELSDLGLIMMAFLLLSVAGLFITTISKSKAGLILVMIGCIAFVPIGLIGALGARKEFNILRLEQFAIDMQITTDVKKDSKQNMAGILIGWSFIVIIIMLIFYLYFFQHGLKSGININKLHERDGIFYESNKEVPYSGNVYAENDNGELSMKGEFIDGFKEGKWVEWDDDGQMISLRKFIKGNPDSINTTWYSGGQIASEIEYNKGILSGIYNIWHWNGIKKEAGTYVSGNKDGVWSYRDGTGRLNVEIEYDMGRSIAIIRNGKRVEYGNVKDVDGNVYCTLKINNKEWMVENLKVTHYRNGDPISNVTDALEWEKLKTGAYCAYENSEENAAVYGYLYNWYAVYDARKIAPKGWRVSTDKDWEKLKRDFPWSDELKDNVSFVYGKNESGFSALAGGYRDNSGLFSGIDYLALFWSSADKATCFGLIPHDDNVQKEYCYEACGLSIRCVRD
jgi:uncharacterized protein (TIGR02145 family)